MSAESILDTDTETSIINWEKMNKTFRNRKLSFLMVQEFDQSSGCDQSMEDLFHSVMEMDYSKIWLKAYDITNSLGYIAADACMDISKKLRDVAKEHEEKNDKKKDPKQVKQLVELYVKLIEAYKNLKVYIATQNQSYPDLEKLESHRSEAVNKYMEKSKKSKSKIELARTSQEIGQGNCKACNIF